MFCRNLFYASSAAHSRSDRTVVAAGAARLALDTLESHSDHSLRARRGSSACSRMPPRQPPIDALAPQPGDELRRTISTGAKRRASWPARAEPRDEPSGDAEVNERTMALALRIAFYWKIYCRDSIDDAGLALDGIVHYGQRYDNAFWDTSG